MKRLIMLAVLCAFVLSAAAASAADIKASGAFINDAMWQSNWAFKDKGGNNNDARVFNIKQRLDLAFDLIANENLKAVVFTRTEGTWGQGENAMGTTSTDAIGLRRAYLDFNYPDTSVRVKTGFMSVALPAAVGGGSFILDEEAAAMMVSGDITDNVGFLAGFVRPYANASKGDDFLDAYAVALPMNFEGFSLTPFGMYGNIGDGTAAADLAGTDAEGLAAMNASSAGSGNDFENAYWLGLAFSMDLFDPFVLSADLNYGKVASDKEQNERSGWLFDAALEYKGFDFMTPEVFFAYTSGEDGNSTEGGGSSERMASVDASNWAVGSFFFGGDTFLQGSMANREAYLGFWALGVSLKDIQSFAEGMTHTATILYAQGTNDKNVGTMSGGTNTDLIAYGSTLTEEDSLIEVDFNTYYKLYDELTVGVELGYLNLDTKESVWGADQKGGDAWKISTGIAYKF